VSGYVVVGIQPTLPVDGVSLQLRNDICIAGEKVIVNPWLSSLPCLPDGSDHVMQDIPGLYPACAITHSMAKKAEKLSPLESDDQMDKSKLLLQLSTLSASAVGSKALLFSLD